MLIDARGFALRKLYGGSNPGSLALARKLLPRNVTGGECPGRQVDE
jgi:hypothetical protein